VIEMFWTLLIPITPSTASPPVTMLPPQLMVTFEVFSMVIQG
jgi:hypothetical protein